MAFKTKKTQVHASRLGFTFTALSLPPKTQDLYYDENYLFDEANHLIRFFFSFSASTK